MTRRRTERRAIERELGKLDQARERAAALEPGGAPERPIEVGSASLVEPIALGKRCHHCDGVLRLVEHDAPFVGGLRLRRVQSKCVSCGKPRTIWVKVVDVSAMN